MQATRRPASRLASAASFPGVVAILLALAASLLLAAPARAANPEPPVFYHLRQGVTFYVVNPSGKDFTVDLDLKDLNIYCQGAQTALVKVYGPEGEVAVDDEIPDDGIVNGGYDQAWAGWDHEQWARAGLRDLGAEALFRSDAFSDPRKVEKIRGTVRSYKVKGTKPGVYQVQVVGCDDHFLGFSTTPALKFGVCGHPDFLAGHGSQFKTTYLYVPVRPWYEQSHATCSLWLIEHHYPRTRKLTLFNGNTPLPLKDIVYETTANSMTADQAIGRVEFDAKALKPGMVLKLVNEIVPPNVPAPGVAADTGTASGGEIVSDPAEMGDFLIRVAGIPPIFCPDEETCRAIAGGTIAIPDGPAVSFAWQKELWDAVKNLKKEDFVVTPGAGAWSTISKEELAKIQVHLWNSGSRPEDVDAAITKVHAALAAGPFNLAKLLDGPTFDGLNIDDLAVFYLMPFKGNALHQNKALRNIITMALIRQWYRYRAGEVIYDDGELNIAYAQGFHWDNWEPVWCMKNDLDPAVLKAFQKGATAIAQRMFYANGLELVLSNGRTTIPLNLYHAYLITGDERLKALSARYLDRMATALDGPHSGRSATGYFREHFSADGGYCTYPLYQLGRLYNISGDPKVYDLVDKLCKWVCYVTLPNDPKNRSYVGPTSWNARIAMSAITHTWGNGYKYIAGKSEWAARIYRYMHGNSPQFYDLADPAYEPGKAVPDCAKALVLTRLTRGVLPAAPFPGEFDKPFFEDIGAGHEFFAIRRGTYYAILYSGKRTPFWMDLSLGGSNNFNGGGIAGLSVNGVGAMVVGRVLREYGWPLQHWRDLTIPAACGELSDGRVFNTGMARNTVAWDAKAYTVKTTGECVTAPVNFVRDYAFGEKSIAATIRIVDAALDKDAFQYRSVFHPRSDFIREAWELIPVMVVKETTLTALDASGKAIGPVIEAGVDNVAAVEVNNGKGGIKITFDKPRTVKLSPAPEPHNPHPHGEGLDHVSKALQIKIADKFEIHGQSEMKYEITPFAK
ncbi:MAG: hypothetical protein NTW19_18150 [Planctomycetota bacterium]|nr:hypothetical protein [Planctomycetota bacterium]